MNDEIKIGDYVLCLENVFNPNTQLDNSGNVFRGNIYLVRGSVVCSCGTKYLDIGNYERSTGGICMKDVHWEGLEFPKLSSQLESFKKETEKRNMILSFPKNGISPVFCEDRVFRKIHDIKSFLRDRKIEELIS